MTALRRLEAVTNELPDPPYPADIRAKGFTFAIDWELIKQGKTWILCSPDMRPWLLLLWAVSWTNAPAGTYDNDDELIAASIGMDLRLFQANRDRLMRGWRLHSDGRLYHDHITSLVLEMAGRREKDRARVSAWRERQKSAAVTRNTDVRTDQNDTGTGVDSTGTGEKKDKAPRKRAAAASQLVSVSALIAEGVDPQVACDWLAVRRVKKLPLTLTAWDGTKGEAAKAGMPIADAIRMCAMNSWGGFKASWVDRPDTKHLGASSVWFETAGGVKAKGAELGIPYTAEDECVPWQRYADRVFKAAGHSPRAAA